MKKRISKDDVQLLSKGKPSKTKSGSRAIPHRLTVKERILFEAAKKMGFLKIAANRPRANLLNVYKLWCEATDTKFIIKETKVKEKE